LICDFGLLIETPVAAGQSAIRNQKSVIEAYA
jgi:hypothetical protein